MVLGLFVSCSCSDLLTSKEICRKGVKSRDEGERNAAGVKRREQSSPRNRGGGRVLPNIQSCTAQDPVSARGLTQIKLFCGGDASLFG